MHVDAQESRLTIIPFQNLPIKRWYEDCISVMSKYKLAKFLQGQRLKKLQARQLREEKEEVR